MTDTISSNERTLSVSVQELRVAAKSGTSDKTWLSHLLELSADEFERLQRELVHWKDCHGVTADRLAVTEKKLSAALQDLHEERASHEPPAQSLKQPCRHVIGQTSDVAWFITRHGCPICLTERASHEPAPAPAPSNEQLGHALEEIESLCDHAYDNGFHELGYDPVQLVRDEIERLQRECVNWKQLHDANETCITEQHRQLRELNERRAAHEPSCEHEWSALRRKHECLKGCGATMSQDGVVKGASQPPSLLREIATVAYDTSKAAEDRIREIQDLWEGAGSTKEAAP